MSLYLALKGVHVTCVILSLTGFVVRGAWMMRGSALLDRRWVRVAPHVVDTLLLASAVALALLSHQYPGVHDWLTAKVTGLLVYIILGSIALRRGRSRRIRIGFWVAALATFGYIVAVALTRDPFPLGIH
ncbi:SirB2 family protein [Thioalbus denitrificans]|uniref:Putative membrane protein SirB2 n=1 Tax=Thioalbus denitrificans TaxID=547122 RepID=A0A369CHC2_9GAMM|nr:SirB2 family protein [Thioalbus denitrificans]RCX33093.1 putative membrane protein SirB2 [Thioalbus denitrificans]